MGDELHIGKELRNYLKSRGFKVRTVAKMIGMSESGLNMAMQKPHANTALLLKIGRAVNYNFFALYVPEKWTAENEVGRLKKQLAEKEAEAAALLKENVLLKKVLKLE